MNRPAPSWEAPVGYVHESMVAPKWRLVVGEKRCRYGVGPRHVYCGRPAVAETDRSHRPDRENWWAYCPDHLYGRWVEDGRVLQWRVVPIDGGVG